MTKQLKNKKTDVEIFREMMLSPTLFIRMMWGLTPEKDNDKFIKGKNITWQQYEIIQSVERAISGEGSKRISIASGHGVGKSTVLSWLVLWFLYCYKDAQVPCTAPTSDQMYDVLWKEVSKWLKKMPDGVQNKYEWTTNYIRVTESPTTWFARAKTARKEAPEALAGIHADHVMMLVDEASGVADEIYNTAEGALTSSDILVILISNPTRISGYFYDTHNNDKDNWQTLQFGSQNSPIVDSKYVNRIVEKHGEDSDEYRIRVLGLFPKEDSIDDKGYVPLLNADKIGFTPDAELTSKRRMGVDPAGQGKDTTEWVVRDNFKAKVVATEKISTPEGIAQKTLTLMEYYGFKAKNASKEIFVDDFGIGSKTVQQLAVAGVQVSAVNVGEPPDDKDRFINKRAEAYWRIKEWLTKGSELIHKDKWDYEIKSNKYKRNLKGKIQMMSKDIMRREGIRSPNRMDALMLTFVDKEELFKKKEAYKQPDWEESHNGLGI